jgi:hypothetical protein
MTGRAGGPLHGACVTPVSAACAFRRIIKRGTIVPTEEFSMRPNRFRLSSRSGYKHDEGLDARSISFSGGCSATSAAYAQAPVKPGSYPARPVRVIVTFAAGGAADFVTRIVAQKLSERIGQQFVVLGS